MPHDSGMMDGGMSGGDMKSKSPMDMLDEVIDMHKEHMDNPDSITPESQQKELYLLQSMKEEMSKMMKSPQKAAPAPLDQTSMPSAPDAGEAANPYSGGNRRYSYAQYRPSK